MSTTVTQNLDNFIVARFGDFPAENHESVVGIDYVQLTSSMRYRCQQATSGTEQGCVEFCWSFFWLFAFASSRAEFDGVLAGNPFRGKPARPSEADIKRYNELLEKLRAVRPAA